ncbi:hypothetical protein AWC38_SpisGene1244 [Stylophora pistillata]|uniref:Uncharacterized protein n=1 Tax=Stylophora pistillata TaxID=50429 RepID=A0A2B4SV88_STYPI|nr:hypothetical protein AWC38_SpisGene1244 [Stylophora pistillata]
MSHKRVVSSPSHSPTLLQPARSNSQRKIYQIAQIRHLEPQKRQYTASEIQPSEVEKRENYLLSYKLAFLEDRKSLWGATALHNLCRRTKLTGLNNNPTV